MNRAKGSSFKQAWKSREKLSLGPLTANFIGLKDLIKLKRAVGRPQDIADLEKLNPGKSPKRR